MSLQQLPVIEATLVVQHTGSVADFTGFTTTLDASDGAPMAPTQSYTFDLNVFAPNLIDKAPIVGVFEEPGGDRVEADVQIESDLITITFFEPVEPTDYRVKVIG